MSKQRTGKIARCSKEVRDRINTMLRDGVPYSKVIKFAEANDCFGLNDQNVTNWKEGGYQDWLNEQERLEDMKAKREFALEIVRQNEGSKLHEAAMQLAASQLYEVITDFDLGRLKALLENEPENYAAIVNSLAKLSKASLDNEKYRESVRAAREAIQEKLNASKEGGISEDTVKFIEGKLKLM